MATRATAKKVSTRHKDFGSNAQKDPVTFSVNGEEFVAHPYIPGKVLIELGKRARSEDPTEAFDVMIELFEVALEEESLGRFEDMLEDVENPLTMDQIADITAFLIEEYSERPEEQRED